MDDLQINKHFTLFKKLLFMEDGEFSLSLSNQLFEKVCDDFCSSLQLLAYLDVPCPTCLNFWLDIHVFVEGKTLFLLALLLTRYDASGKCLSHPGCKTIQRI